MEVAGSQIPHAAHASQFQGRKYSPGLNSHPVAAIASASLAATPSAKKLASNNTGYWHSCASYRIRHLKGNLDQLAEEMGNSPREIIKSYKRNVTDAEANAWFNVLPPRDYWERVYSYVQNGMGRFAVGLEEQEIPVPPVRSEMQRFNADLAPDRRLEARGVEPLSSKRSTQTSTCLSDDEV